MKNANSTGRASLANCERKCREKIEEVKKASHTHFSSFGAAAEAYLRAKEKLACVEKVQDVPDAQLRLPTLREQASIKPTLTLFKEENVHLFNYSRQYTPIDTATEIVSEC